MVRQPEYGARDVNRLFYKAEGRRIGLLNQSFFQDVGLTADENRVQIGRASCRARVCMFV